MCVTYQLTKKSSLWKSDFNITTASSILLKDHSFQLHKWKEELVRDNQIYEFLRPSCIPSQKGGERERERFMQPLPLCTQLQRPYLLHSTNSLQWVLTPTSFYLPTKFHPIKPFTLASYPAFSHRPFLSPTHFIPNQPNSAPNLFTPSPLPFTTNLFTTTSSFG